MTKRILIAGGYGLIGSTFARHIRKAGWDVDLVLGGRNPAKGEALARELDAETVYLDVEQGHLPKDFGTFDLVVATLYDPSGRLIDAALEHGVAHIGITTLADGVAPILFSALRSPPVKPVVLLGHWQAGVLLWGAAKLAESFARVDSVKAVGLYDPLDPLGTMSVSDVDSMIGRALVREDGNWTWVDAHSHARQIELPQGGQVEGVPLGILDVPSLAAVTAAKNVRMDMVVAPSRGTQAGRAASHDIYIEMDGQSRAGNAEKRHAIISDPNGQAHLTALGVMLAAEQVLGLNGAPAAAGGLQTPETLLPAAAAMKKVAEFGVQLEGL
jgi:hypothetical protein